MKKSFKIVVVLTVVTLVFALAGNALAYFQQGDLVRVVWERRSAATPSGTYEVLADLGKWDHLTTGYSGPIVTPNTPAFSLTHLGLSDWTYVYVAYFMVNQTNEDIWVSGVTTGIQMSGARQAGVTYTRMSEVLGPNYLTGQQQNVRLQEVYDSFVNQFTNSGRFANFLWSGHIGHASLSSFNQEGTQYIDQFLYFYDVPNERRYGRPVLTLRTYETGLTELRPIPIPPAVYLLGTGLLGLIGIRRRMKDII